MVQLLNSIQNFNQVQTNIFCIFKNKRSCKLGKQYINDIIWVSEKFSRGKSTTLLGGS